jgi:hypothetical protein
MHLGSMNKLNWISPSYHLLCGELPYRPTLPRRPCSSARGRRRRRGGGCRNKGLPQRPRLPRGERGGGRGRGRTTRRRRIPRSKWGTGSCWWRNWPVDCVATVEWSLKFNNLLCTIGLYHPLDGITNLEYNLLCLLTPNKTIFKEKGASF